MTALDLFNFLSYNGFAASKPECKALLRSLDINQDGLLSYSDFLQAVLPATSPQLRTIATSR